MNPLTILDDMAEAGYYFSPYGNRYELRCRGGDGVACGVFTAVGMAPITRATPVLFKKQSTAVKAWAKFIRDEKPIPKRIVDRTLARIEAVTA